MHRRLHSAGEKLARPSKYSELIARRILSRYGDGEALSKICKDKNMSKRITVYRWSYSHPGLGDQAGEIVDTEQEPQLAIVRSEFHRWLSSKLNRPKYGDKLDVNHNVNGRGTSFGSRCSEAEDTWRDGDRRACRTTRRG